MDHNEIDKLFEEILADLHKMTLSNHEDRLVENTVINGAKIDTCLVTDSLCPYETAIYHPAYSKESWIIVESYDTKEKAKIGHNKWVKLLTEKLPTYIISIDNTKMGKLFKMMFNQNDSRIYKRKDKKE